MPNIDERFKEINDALIVISTIEQRQSRLIKEHSQIIADIDAKLAQMTSNAVATDLRIEKLVSAIGGFIARQ